MKVLPIIVACLVAAAAFLLAFSAFVGGPHDPCDSYGDCLASSLVFVRSNPDHSLYVGDSFTIQLSIEPGSDTSGFNVTWGFSPLVFERSGSTFTVVGNVTGTLVITASVTFTGAVQAGNTTQPFSSTLTTSQSVAIIPLDITLRTHLVNVTDAEGALLRNPDGSFFRNDSFCDAWSASFKFSDARTDIRINVSSVTPPSLHIMNYSSGPLGRTGEFCYSVEVDSGYLPYNVTLVARVVNWLGMSIGLKESSQSFAVVQYHPFFTYFTYMLYNSRNPSTYARPFVTLVRYGGNDPGYSYSGDENTAPIVGGNDTRERALINNFSFITQGWNASIHLVSAGVGQDIRFNRYPVSISYSYLNKTYPVITWQDRVQKYYFLGNITGFEKYARDGVIYYNLTESAYSADFAGASRQPLFNTTYLYEPVQYSGYLIFKFSDADGNPDLTANVTIISRNLGPLNAYLIAQVKGRFGNDPAVLKAFAKDLYPSNYTMSLKQLQPNDNGTIVYLVNQTNLAMPGEAAFPSFNVTVYSKITGTSYQFTSQPPYVTEETTTYCPALYRIPPWVWFFYHPQITCKETSYLVPGGYSLFLFDNYTLPSSPFPNATAYYLTQDLTGLSLPVNSTLSGGPAYYLNWDANARQGPTIDPNDPLSQEPGHLTTLYQLVYGQNSTVNVNTAGGGVEILPMEGDGGNAYQFMFSFTPQSGGATRFWAVDSRGATLINETLPPTTSSRSSFFPPAYYGNYAVTVPVVHNGTMTITIINGWGAKTVIQGIPISVRALAAPQVPWSFITLVTIILLGIGALASLLRLRVARRQEGSF